MPAVTPYTLPAVSAVAIAGLLVLQVPPVAASASATDDVVQI